jgi:hypothetical protein
MFMASSKWSTCAAILSTKWAEAIYDIRLLLHTYS